METIVVGALVGATVRIAIQNLISISKKEIKFVRDFKVDLEKLKNTLITIQSILYHAEMLQSTDRIVKQWLNKLEDVAFEIDNELDELNYHFLRTESSNNADHHRNSKKKKVMSFFSRFNFHDHRLELGHKIRDINKKLDSINQEASGFGLQMRLAGPLVYDRSLHDLTMGTDSFTVDPIFLGRDDDVSKISGMLIASSNDDVFTILPVVGMGGLGKTTLVRKVYRDDKIVSHYGHRIWVHVSENYDPVTVFKSIHASLTKQSVELGSREVALQNLQQSLGDKRYLLVLDNVWNEEIEKWEDFISSLRGVSLAKGNAIIVTTRSANVASIVATVDIHKLEALSEEECWSIIKAYSFGDEDHIPTQFETSIGRVIAKRCGGLPLAAKVVGGLLRGKSNEVWLSIETHWLPEDGNVVSKILKLSFDHLPSPLLKKCFAYCSIFPKGASIHKERLIQLWMAEGFLQSDQECDLEIVGSNFFNLLVQNSLLLVVQKDMYGNIEFCSMHDLVHDLASSILNPKSSVGHQVRYIGLDEEGNDETSPIPTEQAECLRTLFLKGKDFDLMMLSKFKCLHVLILMGDNVKELPNSISNLIHLRCLDISYTRITCLPDSIGELYLLQTLRALQFYYWPQLNYLLKVPSTVQYLVNLRHLCIPNVELPPRIGKLTSLRTLRYFQVNNDKGRGIIELGSLKNLKGELEIYNLENVRDKEEARRACLDHKPNIFKLKLEWNERGKYDSCNDESVLEGLQPHPNLKSLDICGFKGIRFPLWTLKMAVRKDDELEGLWIGLNNLVEVRLTNCKECEEIPMLWHLPHLKSLFLSDLINVRSMGSSFFGNNEVCKESIVHVFPALERLVLEGMSNLTKWAEVETVVAFPRLEYLKIVNCRRLETAPSHFPCLKDLKIRTMDSVLPFTNICGSNLTTLNRLRIECLNGLVSLPDQLFRNNPNLMELDIRHCSSLLTLPLNSALENLMIYYCPNLKSVQSLQDQGFTSLRELEISSCEGLESLPCEMIQSSLEKLSLSGLESLSNFHLLITFLPKLPHLSRLKIVNVRGFDNFSAQIGSVQKLQELMLGRLWNSSEYVSFEMNFDGLSYMLQSIGTLKLQGMQHWDTLPDQLQHLTALRILFLNSYGVEVLPECLGKLLSLHTLVLSNCRKLKCFPSKNAMQGLTKLTTLAINFCLLSKPEFLRQQMPKISHIPTLWVDAKQIRSSWLLW